MANSIVNKRGYLNRDYMFYHLTDSSDEELDFHYHEFDKLVFILSGSVTYIIEGKSYYCKEGDILIVKHHDIHKPIFNREAPYERIVIWLNHDFIHAHNSDEYDLSLCFSLAKKRDMSLVRPNTEKWESIKTALKGLEESFDSNEYASKLMSNSYFIQVLILVNRITVGDRSFEDLSSYHYDRKVTDIINYINDNLSEDLSIEALTKIFFISRSYLMHRFKEETGYSLHNYILQKRLLHSKDLLMSGMPVVEAADAVGFNDYTTFLRAFKNLFHILPSDLK